MYPKEIELMKGILSSYHDQVDVLEWGSGGSTVYFTDFLKKENINYTWTSLEYNRVWYDKISRLTASDKDIDLILFDVGNTELKQRNTSMDEYVSYPSTLGKKYDVIFVDGRKRRRCLLEAKSLLKSGGTVILHDARRTYYHCAFSSYPDRRVLLRTGLWQGRMEDPGIAQKVINLVEYWCFRIYTFSFRFIPNF